MTKTASGGQPEPQDDGAELLRSGRVSLFAAAVLVLSVVLAVGAFIVSGEESDDAQPLIELEVDEGRVLRVPTDTPPEEQAARVEALRLDLPSGPIEECVEGAPVDPLGRCPDGTGDVRRTQGDLSALGAASFTRPLVYDGSSRIKELELQLGAGTEPVRVAISNPEPIRFNALAGISVRTTEWGEIMDSSRSWVIERPADCEAGCRLYLWLTMGPDFPEHHPDAEVLVFADADAFVTIEDMWIHPSDMWKH